jgi:hypothetical protein
MSRQRWRTKAVSIFNMLVALFSFVAMLTSAVHAATPSTVKKLTIAMDSWGSDMIDPWEYPQGSIIQSYLNLRLVTRDETMQTQPLWAVDRILLKD